MKAILNDKITPVWEKIKGKILLSSAFVSPEHLRRAGMGAGLGIILALFLSLFMGSTPTHDTFDMDSESLSLSDLFPQKVKPDNFDPFQKFAYFEANRKPLSDAQKEAIADDTPRLSLVVHNIGQQKSILKSATEKLPNDVTLSISSYTKNYNTAVTLLKDAGFETWLSLHTQTLKMNADNGENALSPTNNLETNIPLMDTQIKGKIAITGIAISHDSLINKSEGLWGDLSHELFAEGYGIFDATSKSLPSSFFYHKDNPAPYINGDITFDTDISRAELKAYLDGIKGRIVDDKNLILTLSIHTPATLDILVEWVNSLQGDGVTLIPLSAQAKI